MQDDCHVTQTEVKSHSPKRTRPGPAPFPMDADCHAIRTVVKSRYSDKTCSGPAPFPMQDNSQGTREEVKSHSSERTRSVPAPCKTSSSRLCTPSPLKNEKSGSRNNTARRVPQRFPLDIASSNVPSGNDDDDDDDDDNANDDDELALTDDDVHVVTAYGAPRPFPMSLSQCLPEAVDASGSKRGAEDGDDQRVTKRSRP